MKTSELPWRKFQSFLALLELYLYSAISALTSVIDGEVDVFDAQSRHRMTLKLSARHLYN